MRPRDYSEFWCVAMDELGREPICPPRGSALRGELAMDELEMYRLVALLDSLGAELPDQLFPHLVTTDDVFHYYATRVGMATDV